MESRPATLIDRFLQTPGWLIVAIARTWQAVRSGQPRRCRFEPSCSNYAIQAVKTFGVRRGLALLLIRLSKCHPWHPGGRDPVKT